MPSDIFGPCDTEAKHTDNYSDLTAVPCHISTDRIQK